MVMMSEAWLQGRIVCWQVKSGEDPLDGSEDVENAVLYYNQAVLYFKLKQYRAALSILDRGFQYIEPPGKFPQQWGDGLIHSHWGTGWLTQWGTGSWPQTLLKGCVFVALSVSGMVPQAVVICLILHCFESMQLKAW